MADYWDFHARADLDAYVETATGGQAGRAAGRARARGRLLPGPHGPGGDLLDGYPFDVLLGSVHWIGAWRFDDLDDPPSMAEWSARAVDACWDAYTDGHRGAGGHRGPATCSPTPT